MQLLVSQDLLGQKISEQLGFSCIVASTLSSSSQFGFKIFRCIRLHFSRFFSGVPDFPDSQDPARTNLAMSIARRLLGPLRSGQESAIIKEVQLIKEFDIKLGNLSNGLLECTRSIFQNCKILSRIHSCMRSSCCSSGKRSRCQRNSFPSFKKSPMIPL